MNNKLIGRSPRSSESGAGRFSQIHTDLFLILIWFYQILLASLKRERSGSASKKGIPYTLNLISVFIIIVFSCANLFPREISISDMDIVIMKLEKNVAEIKKSISDLKEAVGMSAESSVALSEKIKNIEQKTVQISKDTEELSEFRKRIAKLEKSEKGNEQEFEKINNKIKSNEDASKIILNDIYRLKEDIATGRKPSHSLKKPLKEYVPYIALGLSVISLFIALQ